MHSAQLPLLAVAAACCLSLARAADELSAAPVDELLSVEYCNANADCRWGGDEDASCSVAAKQCVCSTHSGDVCQVGPSGALTNTTRTNIVVTLRDVACDRAQLDTLVADLRARTIASSISNPSTTGVCGSVTLIVGVDAPTASLGTTVDSVSAQIREALLAMPTFTKVVLTDDIAVQVSVAQTDSGLPVCNANATDTVTAYDGRCLVLECAVGYSLSRYTLAGKELMTCFMPTSVAPRSAEDDDMSGGAIAAIVIGSLFIVAVAVGLAYFLLSRKAVPEAHKNEPFDTKENDIHV